MDRSVVPGDDFFAYANGGWVKATPIPADKSNYGIWAVRNDEARNELLKLIQDSSSNSGGGKIADYYATFMDEAAIEAKGADPIRPQLAEIAAIADGHALAKAIGSRLRADVDALNNTNFDTDNLFGVWISQGLADPSHMYPYLLQGGLGLPDRDYYVSPSPKMAALRDAYRAYVEAMLRLAGFADAAVRAARVFALETEMAKAHGTRVESEDVHTPQSWTRVELSKKAPGLAWPELLDAAGLNGAAAFIVWQPKAIVGLSALSAKQPLDAWKDWLAFHTIDDAAPYLSKAFVEQRFQFHSKALRGVPEQRPRQQRGIDFTSDDLGELLGKPYAERYFPAASKARVQAMVASIVKAFDKRIDGLEWMSTETKAKAKQKLVTLKVGIGYPDRWRDYSGLEIVKGDAVGNHLRSTLFEYRYQLAKLGRPPDAGDWCTTPQTVNSFNLPLQNALNFPAAIIQPPWFDANGDNARNYGAIGSLIGHEISHSFDNTGAEFDAQGRLTNWWTKADLDHFTAAGEALAKQYDAYRPFPDLAVNGHQTLSENIADVAGLLAAYEAYRASLEGKTDAVVDGFTGDQRFFISFGQSWRSKYREAYLRNIIATDGHSPEDYRADTVRNLDPWYNAFQVAAGQKLYLNPEQRIRVW
jgi:predicted metalloendopeptidase